MCHDGPHARAADPHTPMLPHLTLSLTLVEVCPIFLSFLSLSFTFESHPPFLAPLPFSFSGLIGQREKGEEAGGPLYA
jgi:hypothetical protein